jgi:hypothetical protein
MFKFQINFDPDFKFQINFDPDVINASKKCVKYKGLCHTPTSTGQTLMPPLEDNPPVVAVTRQTSTGYTNPDHGACSNGGDLDSSAVSRFTTAVTSHLPAIAGQSWTGGRLLCSTRSIRDLSRTVRRKCHWRSSG